MQPFTSQESEPSVHSLNLASIKLCTGLQAPLLLLQVSPAPLVPSSKSESNLRKEHPQCDFYVDVGSTLGRRVPGKSPLSVSASSLSFKFGPSAVFAGLEAASSLCLGLWASWLS